MHLFTFSYTPDWFLFIPRRQSKRFYEFYSINSMQTQTLYLYFRHVSNMQDCPGAINHAWSLLFVMIDSVLTQILPFGWDTVAGHNQSRSEI